MTKIFMLTVDSCGECPAFRDESMSGGGECALINKNSTCDSIPEYCPLDDYEGEEK